MSITKIYSFKNRNTPFGKLKNQIKRKTERRHKQKAVMTFH